MSIIGQRFGRLTVLAFSETRRTPKGRALHYFTCACDCGGTVISNSQSIKWGDVRSCGCLRKEVCAAKATIHGKSGHRLYRVWCAMIDRCCNKTNASFRYYGARGIKVCKRWKNFNLFLSDMEHGWRIGLTLERKNNDGGYRPGNVIWASMQAQNKNRRSSQFITFKRVKRTTADWSRSLGGNKGLVLKRIKMGWSVVSAVSTPARKMSKCHT